MVIGIVKKAKVLQSFMEQSQIRILTWPFKSPDLNIVKDIWKLLSNDIYDSFQLKKILFNDILIS